MAYSGSQNIDPALRQNTLSSPPKSRETYQNGGPNAYSPLQPSPNTSYPGMQTPNYYANQQSHESAEEHSPTENPHDPNDLKRPRACEACRQLKVKCEADENSPTGSCKRCAKAGRQCIVTAPSRKRQKKTDSRVAELEKKIDALTATLAARGGENEAALDPAIMQQNASVPQNRPIYQEPWPGSQQPPQPTHSSPPVGPHGVKRKKEYDFDYFGGELQKPPTQTYKPPTIPTPSAPVFDTDFAAARRGSDEAYPVDVIHQRLIDLPSAKRCFERYMSEMCSSLPIVVFPAGTKMEDVRKNKPMLLLAVLAVSSGTIRQDVQPKLINEATRLLADRIVYRGEKSLELIQTIQCLTTFYQPPEKYEELNFNQLIHIAATMALDIGLGKRFKKGNLALWRPYTEQKKGLPDPNSAETRRCWLGCYYMCSNSAMSLRRPLLVRWSPYADECVEILQSAPDAAPTDKWFSLLVRAQHISEQIGLEFSMDDPASQLSLTDRHTQNHLKKFERQLSDWHDSASKDMLKKPIMQHTEGIVNLYMHEIAMHHNHNVDDFRPPYITTPIDGPPDPDFFTPAHVESLIICLRSVHAVFDAFLSMDTKSLRALPTLFFVRNSYAAVALIKLYTAVSAKGSKLASHIKLEDLKVDYYLDRLIATLTKTAEDGMSRVAYKFSLIFNMLRSWHVKRTEPQSNEGSNPISRQRTPAGPSGSNKPNNQPVYKAVPPQQDPSSLSWNTANANAADLNSQPHQQRQPPQAQQQQQQPQQPPSRTGLQMLSDAAMGPGPPQQSPMQQQQPQPQQPWMPQQQPLDAPMVGAPDLSSVTDPNTLMAYGMPGQEFGNFDMDLMAYGFGDEFMAINFGLEQGGWAF